MLGAISEAVVGAETIRAYGVGERTQRRIDAAVDATRARDGARAEPGRASCSPAACSSRTSCSPSSSSPGRYLGVAGRDVGRPAARVPLPRPALHRPGADGDRDPQRAAERRRGLAARARRSSRRPVEVVDAGRGRRAQPARPGARASCAACDFAYPDGPPVLRDVDLAIPRRRRRSRSSARPGRARRRSPSSSRGSWTRRRARCCSTASTCATSPVADLRARVVLVPQEGFLFDGTLARERRLRPAPTTTRTTAAARTTTRIRGGHRGARSDGLGRRPRRTGSTRRSASAASRCRRGSGSSSRSRARTWPRPTCSLLDEATSAVDPATEVRIARALDSLTRGPQHR